MTRLTTMLLLLMCLATHQMSAQTRYLNPVFNQVEVTANVTYGVNATLLYQSVFGEAIPELLKMDIYRPVGDTETNRPLVLYFHTGNFGPFKNPDPTSPVQNGFNGACGGVRTDSAAVEICTRLAKMGGTFSITTSSICWPSPVISCGSINARRWSETLREADFLLNQTLLRDSDWPLTV